MGFRGYFLTIFFILSGVVQAATFDPFFYSFRYKGEKLRFHFRSEPTLSGGNQTVISLVEQRLIMPNSEHAILFGRDLDGDHFPETWFFRGIRYAVTEVFKIAPPQHPEADPSGKLALQKIVPYIEDNLDNRSIVGLALGRTAEFFSFMISTSEQAGRDYFVMQMDLYEIRERADLVKDSATKNYMLSLFNLGWEQNNAALLSVTRSGQTAAYAAVDLALVGFGGVALRFVERGGVWVAKKTGLNQAAIRLSQSSFVRSMSHVSLKAELTMILRGLQMQRTFIEKTTEVLAKQTVKVSKNGTVAVVDIYKQGAHSWQYVLQTQMMQVFSEAVARWDQIYDPNPIVMTENLFGDEGFVQNFFYMTNQTTLLTGISMREKTFGKKMRLCALVSAGNSSAMNLLIRGDVDTQRALFDTGWEITAGSLQTIFDTHMIHKFHEAAIKQRNPKLKLVGYAIAMVDQLVGFYTYSKITQQLAVIPITVEER